MSCHQRSQKETRKRKEVAAMETQRKRWLRRTERERLPKSWKQSEYAAWKHKRNGKMVPDDKYF